MSNTNWQELVNQAKKNDQSAITKLYELTNQNAYFVAISMMKNEDDTFDVLQNAYIKAFNKLDTLESPEKFQSWLNQIVSNECKMMLRKHKDFVFSEFETEDGYDFGDMVENDNIEFNPDSNIEYEETKQAMKEILHKLPDEQRLVVLMFYFQEMTIKEIAETLDCSENTVKSRLNYAKKKIKTEVEELEKKGHKLYGIAPLPLFLWFIKKAATETSVPKALSASVAKAVSATSTTVSANTVAGTVAKAGLTIAQKITIGVVATAVAVTGVVGAVKLTDTAADPEEGVSENISEKANAPTPITEEEIEQLFYDSLEYYDTIIYPYTFPETEKIDGGLEKNGIFLSECIDYSYDKHITNFRKYFSENAIQEIIEKTNLTEHNGKCYINYQHGFETPSPDRYVQSVDSICEIDETTYAIHMTLISYLEEKEEPSVMYCVYENGRWVMDSINYHEPTTHIKPNSSDNDSTSIHENKEDKMPTTNIDITEKVTPSTSITETPSSNTQTESIKYATPNTLPINEVEKLAKRFVAEVQAENVPDSMFTYSDVSVQGIYFAEIKDDSPKQNINELHILVVYTQYLNGEYHSTIYKPRIYKNIVVDKNGKLNIKYSDGRGTGFFYDNVDEYVNELKEDFIITKIK